MTVHIRMEQGPVQLLFGNHEGHPFVEVIVSRTFDNGGGPATKTERLELRGAELRAFASLVKLARPELETHGGKR